MCNKHIPKWHQRCNLDCMHSERLNKKWLHSIFTINSYRKCILLNLRKLQSCLFIHSYKLCKKFKRGRCGRSRPLKIWHHYFTKSWKNWYQLTSTDTTVDKSKHHRMWKELIKLTTTTTTKYYYYYIARFILKSRNLSYNFKIETKPSAKRGAI